MSNLIVIIRSVLTGTIGIATTLINSILVLITIPFGDKVQYKFAIAWTNICHYALKYIAGLDYELLGRENLPKEASVVLMKHQSVWEIVLLFRMIPQLVFVFKREVMAIPIFSHALISLKMIDIDRTGGRTAVSEVISKGTDRLRQGLWVAIFPEGTRMAFGKTRRFGKSGIILAKEANVPLVLIAHNGGEFWPTKTFKIHSGKVKVVISKPIATQGREIEDIVAECEHWMETTMRTISPRYAERADGFKATDKQEGLIA